MWRNSSDALWRCQLCGLPNLQRRSLVLRREDNVSHVEHHRVTHIRDVEAAHAIAQEAQPFRTRVIAGLRVIELQRVAGEFDARLGDDNAPTGGSRATLQGDDESSEQAFGSIWSSVATSTFSPAIPSIRCVPNRVAHTGHSAK